MLKKLLIWLVFFFFVALVVGIYMQETALNQTIAS